MLSGIGLCFIVYHSILVAGTKYLGRRVIEACVPTSVRDRFGRSDPEQLEDRG
jgi:hypothetical protein